MVSEMTPAHEQAVPPQYCSAFPTWLLFANSLACGLQEPGCEVTQSENDPERGSDTWQDTAVMLAELSPALGTHRWVPGGEAGHDAPYASAAGTRMTELCQP